MERVKNPSFTALEEDLHMKSRQVVVQNKIQLVISGQNGNCIAYPADSYTAIMDDYWDQSF